MRLCFIQLHNYSVLWVSTGDLFYFELIAFLLASLFVGCVVFASQV